MTMAFTAGLIMCVMFCGLSIDIGMLELQKTQMQKAADSAAIAADMYFERAPSQDGLLGTDAAAAAAQYGFVDGTNQTTVTATASLAGAGAVGGDYNGHHDTVQVTITRQVPTIFMGVLNNGRVTVAATAIASPPPCEYFLGTKNLVSFTVNMQNTAATAQWYSKCSAYVGGGMYNPSGAWWQAFQTYFTGSPAASTLLGRTKQGTTFNTAVRADPLAGIAQPATGGCAATNYTYGSFGAPSTVTLNPGTYCGSVSGNTVTPGMTLTNLTVTFNPGLYVITGGVNWQLVNASGSGVTFFFTNVSGTTKYGTVSMVGAPYGAMNLSALSGIAMGSSGTNGAIGGILFFADRNWINTTAEDFALNPINGTLTYNGVWYLPYTGLSLQNGAARCSGYCAMVADNLYLANFTHTLTGTDYTQYPGLNPLRSTSVLIQ